jgi:flagellar biogenesis protein FliO
MSATYYFQVLATLCFFSGLLLLMWKLGKVVQNKKYSGDIKVVDRMPVDNGVSVCIVNIRGQEYLMSIGGKEVRLLKEL